MVAAFVIVTFVIAALVISAFVIVALVIGVFDRASVGFTVDRHLEPAGRLVIVAKGIAKLCIDEFKLRRGPGSVPLPRNGFQGVRHELAVSKQLHGDFRQGDGNGFFSRSIQQMDRHRVRALVVQ